MACRCSRGCERSVADNTTVPASRSSTRSRADLTGNGVERPQGIGVDERERILELATLPQRPQRGTGGDQDSGHRCESISAGGSPHRGVA